ncbi:hypothetical protein [Ornithinimicrobium pratense]|uniref:Uncharacterized protein n=1 Tax=Ornithinimicrobium pratense TaxID=2593973 RepID=A0A5J6VAA8_9MICO|nr:hypothetical protein [Ornithinimicrobium pratense]QFG70022.1 hypothetical protein FY030_16070 [Ornithinimicrobium pratense]
MSLPPGVRRRQQQVARWARRTPGYRFALEEVLPRVRRNATLTDLAWRIFAPRHGAGNVDVALLPDRQVTGPDVGRLPVVGVLATGLEDARAEQLLADVADLQRATGSFRPVLVLDRPVFAAARRHGYVVEHVVPEREWATDSFGEVPWPDYLARRLGSVIDHYQLWHLVRAEVPADGGRVRLDQVDEALLRVLGERLGQLGDVGTEPPASS